MENWIIIKTTDGKNVGKTFTVPKVDKNIAYTLSGNRFWFDKLSFNKNGNTLILINSNYKVTLNKIS